MSNVFFVVTSVIFHFTVVVTERDFYSFEFKSSDSHIILKRQKIICNIASKNN